MLSPILTMLQYILFTLSIALSFILGYFTALRYAIIKRKDIGDNTDITLEAVKDFIHPPLTRIISPSKDKLAKDLLRDLENE